MNSYKLLKNTSLVILVFAFINNCFAQTQPFNIILGTHNEPITEVQFSHNGNTVIQTQGMTTNTMTTAPVLLDYFEINDDKKLYLNDYGNVVRENNFNTNTQGVGIHKEGTLVVSTASEFEANLEETVNNNDLMQFLYYDGTANVPTGSDFDIFFAKGLNSSDFVAVGERDGNTHFKITPLNQFGDTIPNSETIRFGFQSGTNSGNGTNLYDWDLGYSPFNQTTQSICYTIIKASLFNVGTETIYGFRIDNNGQADVKFFGLNENGFEENPTNPMIGGLSGNVFNDANGLTDATVNGTPISLPSGVTIYANLYDAVTNLVIASVPIKADGSFEFLDLAPGSNYAVSISTIAGTENTIVPAQNLPPNWEYTGDNSSTNPGDDGTVDGIQNSLVVVEQMVTEVNFGIQQIPAADPYNFLIESPEPNSSFIIGSDNTSNLSGQDSEDGALSTGGSFGITSLPTNGNSLVYDGIMITVGQDGINPPSPTNPFIVTNYDPSLLEIIFDGVSTQSNTSFDYVSIDAAGALSEPVTYMLSYPALPVEWLAFRVVKKGNKALIEFSTAIEINNSHFSIQKSLDGNHFREITQIEGALNAQSINNYSFIDENLEVGMQYYRVMQVDMNGKFSYTEMEAVELEEEQTIIAFPNPVSLSIPYLNLKNVSPNDHTKIDIYNMYGMLLKSFDRDQNPSSSMKINLENLPAGQYIVKVGENQKPILFNIIE